MGKLTDTKLRAIKGTGKAFKLADGRGLYLYVSASGTRSWRMDYSYGGKRKTYTFGQYPDIPLSDVRNQHISFRQQLAKGIDPNTQKQALKASIRAEQLNAFEVIARTWCDKMKIGYGGKTGWTERTYKTNITRLQSNVFPLIGHKELQDIIAT